ncbi:hypothetical protein D3C72_754950 [compost metagenome]
MADLGNQARHVLHLLHDVVHGAPGGVNLIGARLHLAGAGINQLANIVGGAGATASQMTHLSGHHGKAFTLLARTRRFNRRIQRQDIGLEGNIVD